MALGSKGLLLAGFADILLNGSLTYLEKHVSVFLFLFFFSVSDF